VNVEVIADLFVRSVSFSVVFGLMWFIQTVGIIPIRRD